jgi:hypothetical protein
MMQIFRMLFGGRSRGIGGLLGRRQPGLAQQVGARRGGMALGTIATIAAPFVIRKLMERRAQRQPAY